MAWQLTCGRHGLPWQQNLSPYTVWVSEVMLQQTQVATVLVRYTEFLQRFPKLEALATASLDEVLAMWSGLGYYSRARNLWRCAGAVWHLHGGVFPKSAAELAQLPGIGPSTAAAIASICFGQRVSIFDGNVKRVLGRLAAFDGDLSSTTANKLLCGWADSLVGNLQDASQLPSYTQGLMDLGATVCTAKKPSCTTCPFSADCAAAKAGEPTRWPIKSKRIRRSAEIWHLLVCWQATQGDLMVWLEQRPATGIWALLHVPPVFTDAKAMRAAVPPTGTPPQPMAAFKHVLTHKDLYLHPHLFQWPVGYTQTPSDCGQWVGLSDLAKLGLPSAVSKILKLLPAFTSG